MGPLPYVGRVVGTLRWGRPAVEPGRPGSGSLEPCAFCHLLPAWGSVVHKRLPRPGWAGPHSRPESPSLYLDCWWLGRVGGTLAVGRGPPSFPGRLTKGQRGEGSLQCSTWSPVS